MTDTATESLSNLRHMFTFHSPSGVCLYYHPFKAGVLLDPQLVAGFLSATDFMSKKKFALKKAKPGFNELVYKEFHVLVQGIDPCLFVILTEGKASNTLMSKVSEYIELFMRKFDEPLKDWLGNVRIFKDVENDVRSVFGLTQV